MTDDDIDPVRFFGELLPIRFTRRQVPAEQTGEARWAVCEGRNYRGDLARYPDGTWGWEPDGADPQVFLVPQEAVAAVCPLPLPGGRAPSCDDDPGDGHSAAGFANND